MFHAPLMEIANCDLSFAGKKHTGHGIVSLVPLIINKINIKYA